MIFLFLLKNQREVRVSFANAENIKDNDLFLELK
jgi:hypothetical protein